MGNDNKARLEDIRRRFAEVGVEAISPQETIELLLAYASPRGNNCALSQELTQKYGSLKSLFSASFSQLRYAGGLSEYHAVFFSLIGQIGRQIFLEDMERRPDAFAESAHIGRYFLELVRGQPREAFYELCLNGGDFLACASLTDGGALSEEMEARDEIIRRAVEGALASDANTVVLCRRLSGELLAPTASDRVLIAELRAAFDTIRVNFRDYFLVDDDDFVSLLETGAIGSRREMESYHGTL